MVESGYICYMPSPTLAAAVPREIERKFPSRVSPRLDACVSGIDLVILLERLERLCLDTAI